MLAWEVRPFFGDGYRFRYPAGAWGAVTILFRQSSTSKNNSPQSFFSAEGEANG